MSTRRAPIKIPKEVEIKHFNPTLFPDGNVSLFIVGTTGSGKSTLVCSLLPQLAADRVILCTTCLPGSNKAHVAIEDWCEKFGLDFGLCETPEEYEQIMDAYTSAGILSPASPTACIFDDFLGSPAHKNAVTQTLARYRGLGVSRIVIMTSPQWLECCDRQNITAIIFFRTNNVDTWRFFTKETKDLQDQPGGKEILNKLIRHVQATPFCYIWRTASPFSVGLGIGGTAVPLIKMNKLTVPSLDDVLRLTNTKTTKELAAKAKEIQRDIGNGSSTQW